MLREKKLKGGQGRAFIWREIDQRPQGVNPVRKKTSPILNKDS